MKLVWSNAHSIRIDPHRCELVVFTLQFHPSRIHNLINTYSHPRLQVSCDCRTWYLTRDSDDNSLNVMTDHRKVLVLFLIMFLHLKASFSLRRKCRERCLRRVLHRKRRICLLMKIFISRQIRLFLCRTLRKHLSLHFLRSEKEAFK